MIALLTFWQCSSSCSSVCYCLPLLQTGIDDTFNLTTRMPIPSLESFFPACCSSLYTDAWVYSSRIWYFPFLNSMRFLLAHFSSQGRSFQMKPKTDVSSTPPSTTLSADWQSVRLIPSLMSLMKKLNTIWPTADPRGTPLLTNPQPDFVPLFTACLTWLLSQVLVHITVYLPTLYCIHFSTSLLLQETASKPYWSQDK